MTQQLSLTHLRVRDLLQKAGEAMTAWEEPRRSSEPMREEGGFKRLLAGLNTLSMSSSRPGKHELSYCLCKGYWPEVARGFQISSAESIPSYLLTNILLCSPGKERKVRGKCTLSKILCYFLRAIKRNQGQSFQFCMLTPDRDGSLQWCLETDPLVTGNLNFVYNVLQVTWRRGTALMKRPLSPFLDKNPRSDLYHDVKERASMLGDISIPVPPRTAPCRLSTGLRGS